MSEHVEIRKDDESVVDLAAPDGATVKDCACQCDDFSVSVGIEEGIVAIGDASFACCII